MLKKIQKSITKINIHKRLSGFFFLKIKEQMKGKSNIIIYYYIQKVFAYDINRVEKIFYSKSDRKKVIIIITVFDLRPKSLWAFMPQ